MSATLELARPVVSGHAAEFDVTLDFTADAGERLSFFSLDVAPSLATLSVGASDFAAFSFEKATPLLDEWTQIGFFDDAGFESTVEFDDSLIASLPSGRYRLGTLRVDFGSAGVAFGEHFSVSIEGPETVVGIEDASGFRFEAVAFQPGSQDVVPVSVSGPASVNEGQPYVLTVATLISHDADFIIDWGDGQEQTIDATSLPPSGEVSHVYSDGEALHAILVDVQLAEGTRGAAGNQGVTVNNIAPTIVLSGPAEVDEGATFTLALGDVIDPGDDTATAYIIDWGDSQQQTIQAVDLPSSREVVHSFSDGPATHTVRVAVVDEDGTHDAGGVLDLAVEDVPPNIPLSGPQEVEQDTPYTLIIGAVNDPGDDEVTQYIVDWGDGTQVTLDASQLPPSGEITHTFTEGNVRRTIVVSAIDEDGTHPASGTFDVRVIGDMTPTITVIDFTNSAGEPGDTDPGEEVVIMGTLGDPELLDDPRVVVDWGDGTPPQPVEIVEDDGVGTISASHFYPEGGVYTITAEITAVGSPPVTVETIAYITGTRLADDRLQIVGTDGNDIITVTPSGATRMFVNMTLAGRGNTRRFFDLEDVSVIELHVGAGNDRVMVSDRLVVATSLHGGPDNDRLQGGDGPNLIVGGPGDDEILGGEDRDILVGGEGANLILGYAGDDLLVGGVWQSATGSQAEAFQIWNSDAPLAQRQQLILTLLELAADAQGDSLDGGDGDNFFLLSASDVFAKGEGNDQQSVAEAVTLGLAQPVEAWDGIYAVSEVALAQPAAPTEIPDAEPEAAQPSQVQVGHALVSPLDINSDGFITAVDVVILINSLNEQGSGRLAEDSYHLDPSGDGWLTPVDALLVINFIGSPRSFGEGEASAASPSMSLAARSPSKLASCGGVADLPSSEKLPASGGRWQAEPASSPMPIGHDESPAAWLVEELLDAIALDRLSR